MYRLAGKLNHFHIYFFLDKLTRQFQNMCLSHINKQKTEGKSPKHFPLLSLPTRVNAVLSYHHVFYEKTSVLFLDLENCFS